MELWNKERAYSKTLKSFPFHIHSVPEEKRKCDLCDVGEVEIEINFIFYCPCSSSWAVSWSDLWDWWMQAAVLYIVLYMLLLDCILYMCFCYCVHPLCASIDWSCSSWWFPSSVSVILKVLHEYPDQDPVVWTPAVSWLAQRWRSSVPPTAETLSWCPVFLCLTSCLVLFVLPTHRTTWRVSI